MKAERQQKESQQADLIQSKRERSRLSFVDNRSHAASQTKLIQSIQKKKNRTGLSNDIKAGTMQLKLVPLSENGKYVDDITGKEYDYLGKSIMYPINGMYRFIDLITRYEVQFHENDIQFRGVSSVQSSSFAKFPSEQKVLKRDKRVEVYTSAGPTLTRLTARDVQTTSKMSDFSNVKVGTTYVEIIKSLRKGGHSDPEIASILLNKGYSDSESMEFLRAAAMLESIVGLSEWFRDEDAPSLFRAVLRLMTDKKETFADLKKLFKFAKSAKEGREQATQVRKYFTDGTPTSPKTASIIPYLSPKPK